MSIILTSTQTSDAWIWLKTHVPLPLVVAGQTYGFHDLANWHDPPGSRLMHGGRTAVDSVAHLYCVSQIGHMDDIMSLCNGGVSVDLEWYAPKLDLDLTKVINGPKRFRHSLSEHIAFWVRLALASKASTAPFASKRPHIQPEDKGPDGLFIQLSNPAKVELVSVKSSEGDPKNIVSSARFRNKGVPQGKKQLDEFHEFVNNTGSGLARLNEMCRDVCSLLDVDSKQFISLGLQNETTCHAIVVADHQYGHNTLFTSFAKVGNHACRREATYIGSDDWKTFAEAVRVATKEVLVSVGVF